MDITVKEAIHRYLETVQITRSENTYKTYQNALKSFLRSLDQEGKRGLMVKDLTEKQIIHFASDLKQLSPSSEKLYLVAVNGFYQFLAAEDLAFPNLNKVKMLIKQRSRRQGLRLPQFEKSDLDIIVNYFTLPVPFFEKINNLLIYLRNRSFILLLADTGLRVHESCNLTRGSIDWNEQKMIVLGKGDAEAIVRISKRGMLAMKEYLSMRSNLDGISGKPLHSLPIFARHDKGAGKKVLPITPTTGRNIVNDVVKEILGEDKLGSISPHSFRHYFVTNVLIGSGGNLKLAQELARHKNIQVTQRYAHLSNEELDRVYFDLFDNN